MKIVKYIIYGALTGLCLGVILSVAFGCRAVGACGDEWCNAFISCGGHTGTCSGGWIKYISDSAVQKSLIFSTLICTLIGGANGTFKTLQDRREARKVANLKQSAAEKKQREKWAGEVKKQSLSAYRVCSQNKIADKNLVWVTYKANAQMTDIVHELAKIAEIKGKVDSLSAELSKEDGVSI